MVSIVMLSICLLSLTDTTANAQSPASESMVSSTAELSKQKHDNANLITKSSDQQAETSQKPVAFQYTGRLIWRTRAGFLRIQFGSQTRSFRIQGDLSELQSCNLGDLVEVTGKGIQKSSMVASRIRKLEPWDGTELVREEAVQGESRVLWRYVTQIGTVREVLQMNNSSMLFIGKKFIITTDSPLSHERVTSLMGTRIKVSGTSFKFANNCHEAFPETVYLGVLDPDRQIEIVKQDPEVKPVRSNWMTLKNATIDYVGPRYMAISGYGFSTAMSGRLRPGDTVDVSAWGLDQSKRSARAARVTVTGRSVPTAPENITNTEILQDELIHRVVEVKATVEHCFTAKHGLQLMLSDNQRTYLVDMPLPDRRRQVDQYARGVVVSLTGVVRSISQSDDEALKLEVANADDLVIAETPMQFQPWLVKSMVAGCLTFALFMVFWYWALRRQVRRKTAELNTSTNQMMAAASAVRDGLLIFDAGSRVKFVSDKVNSTLGISVNVGDSERSTRLALEPHVYELDSFNKSWKDAFRNPLNTFEGEFTLQKSGRRVFAYSAPVYDDARRPDGRIWTFEDITERRNLENETLRTRKLGAIGRLAGGVAHDFNNLLQVIGSNLELVQFSKTQNWLETEKAPLTTATAAIQRGADLTRQLLTFAKTSCVEIAPTDINFLLEQTAGMLDRTLGNHIRLSVSLKPDLPHAEIDSGQLEQVIINMCLNSREAIGLNDGYIRISTKCIEHHQIGPSVMISIEDDGCGMSPEIQSHVFEPFFTTKDFDKGTGLGLATAFGAIEQMQGRIECNSTPGKGTCFQIFLPASINVPRQPELTVAPQSQPSVLRRVLLVDDDDRVLQSVKQLLIYLGHEVVCASGGTEAIFKLSHESIDLVMLDLSMPEMTGWQVLQEIREQHANLKVIVCSGYSDNAAKMVASNIAPDAYLNKPFQLQQLQVALESISQSEGTIQSKPD